MKNSLKVLLMLTAISLSSPSYAQLGDLFRKFGDAVDSVAKNIESSNNETKSESASSVTDDSQKSVSAEQKNTANRQSFGIKGFTLRGSLPTNTKITNSNSKQLGNDNVLNTVNFETTILEVPFFGIAVLLNNQIAEVYYFDEITVREFQKREEFTNNIVMTRKLGPLTSYDFSKVANDLVLLINSSLNNPKGQPRTSKINHDKSIAGLCFQHSVMKRLNNNSDKGVEQIAAACNTIQNLINKQCRNCKSTEYGFSWKTDTTDVNVLTVVPESKDMPYAMNFLYIGYKDIELVKKLSQLVNAQKNSDDIQKNRILNESKQREQQMNRERDEKRKKDF
jgi:hypothetical protein